MELISLELGQGFLRRGILGKKRKRNQIKKIKNIKDEVSFFKKHQLLFVIGGIFLFAVIYFYPIAYGNYRTLGADVDSGKRTYFHHSKLIEISGEKQLLWNPISFSGQPAYDGTFTVKNLDIIIHRSYIIFYPIGYFIFGAIGIFLLSKYLKFYTRTSFLISIAFMLLPHWSSLLQEGHFWKIDTLMYIPLLIFLFLKLIDKPNLKNLSLYIIFQSLQLRAHHYQIIYYTIILMTFLGIFKIFDFVRKKKSFKKSFLYIFISLIIASGIAFQPIVLANEFTPFTIRGTTGEEKSSGLSKSYATSWSLSPKELITFIIPRYFGGQSSEIYDIKSGKFQHLNQLRVPGYWGEMPFSSSTDYYGIVLLIFTTLGIVTSFRKRLIKTLILFSVFAIFLSFGRHFPIIHNLLFNFAPGFNKFRAPAMIINVVQIVFVIFAGFGLNFFLSKEKKDIFKPLFITFGILFIIGIFAYIFGTSLNFAKLTEANHYNFEILNMIKEIRKEFLFADITRYFIFLILVLSVCLFYLKSIIKNKYFIFTIILVFIVIDFSQIHRRYIFKKINNSYINLQKEKKNEKISFFKSESDKFLLSKVNPKLKVADYRIYPIYPDFWNSNNYSTFHSSIGGYSPAKLRITQDIIDFGRGNNFYLSPNISAMLNAKYFLTSAPLPREYPQNLVKLVFKSKNEYVYENLYSANRAWFVGDYVIAKTREERFNLLNNSSFNIHQTAILESPLKQNISPPKNEVVNIQKLYHNTIQFNVKNDNQSLLVISETYYPKGWRAFIDEEETEIFKTNHVLRGIVVPKGEHTVSLTFMPLSLKYTHYISLFFTVLSYLLLFYAFVVKGKINAKKNTVL